MRAEKQFLLDQIEDQLQNFEAFVVTDYAGLSANEAATMRTELKKRGGRMAVVRKRVFAKALSKMNLSMDLGSLTGHIGIVFAPVDAMETFKFVCNFSKDTSRPNILSGRFEGKMIEAQTVKVLASLPSRDEMRSQFLGTLEAPMAQMLAVVEALLERDGGAPESQNQSE
jgi:large subunit ribosomal protein L10